MIQKGAIESGKIKTQILDDNLYDWENSYEKLQKTEYTKVFKIQARNKSTGKSENLVIKQFILKQLSGPDREYLKNIAKNEYKIHTMIYKCNEKMNNVVRPIADSLAAEDAYYEILMEHGGNTLYQDIDQLSGAEIIDALNQCCVILKTLVLRQTNHGDIKSKNFARTLIPPNKQIIKIFDFGVSQEFAQTMFKTVTAQGQVLGGTTTQHYKIKGFTEYYVTPEQLGQKRAVKGMHKVINPKAVDMYALGITFLELARRYDSKKLGESFNRRNPDEGEEFGSYKEKYEEWLTNETGVIQLSGTSTQDNQKFIVILKKMLDFDFRERATAEKLSKVMFRFGKFKLPEIVKQLSNTLAPIKEIEETKEIMPQIPISAPAPIPEPTEEVKLGGISGEEDWKSKKKQIIKETDSESERGIKELENLLIEIAREVDIGEGEGKPVRAGIACSMNDISRFGHYNPIMKRIFSTQGDHKFGFKQFTSQAAQGPFPSNSTTVVTCTNKVFLIGGSLPDSKCLDTIYEIVGGTVQVRAQLPKPRYNIGVLAIKNAIYLLGGELQTNLYVSNCELYNIANQTIPQLPQFSESKGGVSVCSFGDKYIYAFGGFLSGDTLKFPEDLNTAELNLDDSLKYFGELVEYFNEVENAEGAMGEGPLFSHKIERLTLQDMREWESVEVKGDMYPVALAGCVQVNPTCILLFGGYNELELTEGNKWEDAGQLKSKSVKDYRIRIFNTQTSAFEHSLEGKKPADIFFSASFCQAYYINGKILAMSSEDYDSCSLLYRYDILNDKWTHGFLGDPSIYSVPAA